MKGLLSNVISTRNILPVASLLLLSSLALSLLSAPSVKATNNPLLCTDDTASFEPMRQVIESSPSYDPEDTSYFIFKREWGGYPLYGNYGAVVKWTGDNQALGWDDNIGISFYTGTNILAWNGAQFNTVQDTYNISFSDVSCFAPSYNLDFDSTWHSQVPEDNRPPDLANQAPVQDIYRPDYEACVLNNRLKITDKSTPLPGEFPYTLHYVITQGTFETQTYFFEGDLQPYGQIELNLPNAEPFGIQLWYFDENGNIINDTEISDFRETDITFTNTVDQCQDTTDPDVVCDENDHCTVPSPTSKYEDCSEHNFNIKFWDTGVEWSIPSPVTIGCAVSQIPRRIADIFAFVLDTIFSPLDTSYLTEHTQNTHGLTSIITAPLMMFTDMTAENYTCDPITLPLPYMTNKNIQLPCMTQFYQSSAPALFALYQTIISGIISYYLLVGYLRLIKGFKDPKNDKIEVTQL